MRKALKPPGVAGEEKRRKLEEQHHRPAPTVGALADTTSVEAAARAKPPVVPKLEIGGCGAGSGLASSGRYTHEGGSASAAQAPDAVAPDDEAGIDGTMCSPVAKAVAEYMAGRPQFEDIRRMHHLFIE